jgi:hypothetical protein
MCLVGLAVFFGLFPVLWRFPVSKLFPQPLLTHARNASLCNAPATQADIN